jgi:hypothetical protein
LSALNAIGSPAAGAWSGRLTRISTLFSLNPLAGALSAITDIE